MGMAKMKASYAHEEDSSYDSFGSESESDKAEALETIKPTEQQIEAIAHQAPASHQHAVLKFLLGLDFKKHVDILRLVNLSGFDLTEEEEESNCTTSQILKVLKIILYQLGIYEERQKWVNQDFMTMYKEEEKARNKQVDDQFERCRDLNNKLAFDFENIGSQVKLFYNDTLKKAKDLEIEMKRVEMISLAQHESTSQALGYMTEFLNIQNCIDIKLASEASKA